MPGVYEKLERALKVKVRALGVDGEPFAIEADGLLAICIQHEIDHLEGRVFVERLSRLKQGRIRSRMQKRRERPVVA